MLLILRHLRELEEDLPQTRRSFWDYLTDRVAGTNQIPALSELLRQHLAETASPCAAPGAPAY